MIQKSIKITSSPFQPSIEIVANFIVKLHVPYSEKMVTVQISPNIVHYEDKAQNQDQNIQVRQSMVTLNLPETQTLTLDFDKMNIAKFTFMEKNFTIKLLNIGKVNLEKQDFPTFEFFIEER